MYPGKLRKTTFCRRYLYSVGKYGKRIKKQKQKWENI